MSYTSPFVPNSDLPALLGLRTLINHGALIDCRNKMLYLCGPGDAKIEPPPGTMVMRLEQSPSGHPLLPISDYGRCKAWEDRCRAQGHPSNPEIALPATTPTTTSTTSSSSSSSSSSASAAPAAPAESSSQLRPPVGTGRSEGTRCPLSPAGREGQVDRQARAASALAGANVPSGPAAAGQQAPH